MDQDETVLAIVLVHARGVCALESSSSVHGMIIDLFALYIECNRMEAFSHVQLYIHLC